MTITEWVLARRGLFRAREFATSMPRGLFHPLSRLAASTPLHDTGDNNRRSLSTRFHTPVGILAKLRPEPVWKATATAQ